MLYITCPSCGKSFQVDDDYYTYLQSQGATPVLFCSRARCSSGRDGCGKEISAREQILEEMKVRKHAR